MFHLSNDIWLFKHLYISWHIFPFYNDPKVKQLIASYLKGKWNNKFHEQQHIIWKKNED